MRFCSKRREKIYMKFQIEYILEKLSEKNYANKKNTFISIKMKQLNK